MKTKLFKTFLSVVVISLLIGILPVTAANGEKSVGEAQDFIDGILAYELNKADCDSVQQWIDGSLASNAGVSSEWYIIALSQNGDYDFGAYETALLKFLSENTVSSASSRQKIALALIASGSNDQYISEVLNGSIGEQGIMSWIYGLHILNNGYTSNVYSSETVKEKILSLQLNDGGWAVSGSRGDIDATAMAVQALASYYEDSKVKAAVDNALSFLSSSQKENGDYASYGVNNPESTSQVLVALSSLGIDCKTDERFIKNGNTLFDAIALYRLPDGSFCHKLGGASNNNATVQVFCSMIAYLRVTSGKTDFYLLDNRHSEESETSVPEQYESSEQTVLSEEPISDDSSVQGTESETAPKFGYKFYATVAIVAAAGTVCLVLFLLKKRNKKNFMVIAVIAVAAIFFVVATDFQSPEDYYQNAEASKENVSGTVTVTIRCDTITEKSEESHIPADGIILGVTECDIEEGDTVYDVLAEITAKNKLHLETNGSAEMIYVEGIANIYEFDFGDLSGWVYHVNGVPSSVSCGEYKLLPGDRIEWLYTCDLGEDVK